MMPRIIATHVCSVLDLKRATLTQVATRVGVVVERDGNGRLTATSPVDGIPHFTTWLSCDCAAFIRDGACLHHAAAIAFLENEATAA